MIGPVGVGAGVDDVVDVIERLPVGAVGPAVGDVVVDVVETDTLPLIAYMLSLFGPPQYSVVLPPQSIEQPFVAGSLLA